MKDFKIFLTAIFFALAGATFAQEDEDSVFDEEKTEVKEYGREARNKSVEDLDPATMKPGKLKKYGKRFYKIKDYYTAIEFLSPYVELNPDDKKRMEMLALSYEKTRSYRDAEDMFSRLIALDGSPADAKKPEYLLKRFQMAKSATKNGRDVDPGEGESMMKTFKKIYKKDDKTGQVKIFKAAIEGARQFYVDGGFMQNDSMLVIPLPEEINQESMELSPIIVDRNTLMFGSLVADTDEFYDFGKRPGTALFFAKFWEDHHWSNEGYLPGPFNEPGYDIVGGAYSWDQERFYFSKCPIERYKESICSIWKSEYKNGEWSEPEKLNEVINDPDYSSKYPSLGVAKGRRNQDLLLDVLYYSTDKPKSRGGYDIWYSVIDEKTRNFKKSKGCGSKINTAGDEITPFYNGGTQELYFSSNGHPGYGGFDVFKNKGFEKKYEQLPSNLLSPINSPADDYYYIIDKKQDQGFFVSNRLGSNSELNPTCCDDIYQFRDKTYIEIIVSGQIFELNDSVNEKTEDNFLDGTQVTLLALMDGGDTTIVEGVKPNGEEGYVFDLVHGQNYLITAEKEHYESKTVPFSTKEYVYSDSTQIDLGLKLIPPTELHVPRLHYASNEALMSEETKTFLTEGILKQLNEHPELKVHIEGHADDVGSDKYNVKLSKKRAKFVYKFLVKSGIDESRLSYEGYGETKPLQNYDGTDAILIKNARDLNRRVEFSVEGEGYFKFILDEKY